MKLLLAVLFLVGTCVAYERSLTDEERLIKDVLRRYISIARPAKEPSDTVKVSLNYTFIRVADFDQENAVIKVSGWLPQQWDDFRLSWEPEKYGGISALRLPSDKVWRPDIKLYNGMETDMDVGSALVVVQSSGMVLHVPTVMFEVPCTEGKDASTYSCEAKLGSWTYDESLVNVGEPAIDTEYSSKNPSYDVSNFSAERHAKKYPCCPEIYVDVTYKFDLKVKNAKGSCSKKENDLN